jgi:hypothetical protein
MSSLNISNPDNAFTETNLVASYSPNDLYYMNMTKLFENTGTYNPIVDYTTCDKVDIDVNACNTTSYFNNNTQNCVKKQLCINKEYAEKIKDLQTKHNGADEKFEDINSVYGLSVINIFNLGIGIVFLIFLINKYSKIN